VLKGNADQVNPEWFRTDKESDTVALQQAVDSCAGLCMLMLTKQRVLSKVSRLGPSALMHSYDGWLGPVGTGAA
jgi:hypothetical protein